MKLIDLSRESFLGEPRHGLDRRTCAKGNDSQRHGLFAGSGSSGSFSRRYARHDGGLGRHRNAVVTRITLATNQPLSLTHRRSDRPASHRCDVLDPDQSGWAAGDSRAGGRSIRQLASRIAVDRRNRRRGLVA